MTEQEAKDALRVILARAYDPEAFEDHPLEAVSRVASIQWAARRKMAGDAADRVVGSGVLSVKPVGISTEHVKNVPDSLQVVAAPSGTDEMVSTGEHKRVLHQNTFVCDTCVNGLGLNIRWDRIDRVADHPRSQPGITDAQIIGEAVLSQMVAQPVQVQVEVTDKDAADAPLWFTAAESIAWATGYNNALSALGGGE